MTFVITYCYLIEKETSVGLITRRISFYMFFLQIRAPVWTFNHKVHIFMETLAWMHFPLSASLSRFLQPTEDTLALFHPGNIWVIPRRRCEDNPVQHKSWPFPFLTENNNGSKSLFWAFRGIQKLHIK